jgi:hypothetical protein
MRGCKISIVPHSGICAGSLLLLGGVVRRDYFVSFNAAVTNWLVERSESGSGAPLILIGHLF